MSFSPTRRLLLSLAALSPLGCGTTRHVRAAFADMPRFSFIQVTDLHYIPQPSTDAYMRALMAQLNRYEGEVDFVVVTGDLTQNATEAEIRGIRRHLDTLQLPWYAVPGNHDMNRRAWLKYFPHYDSYSYAHDNAELIFLDSTEEEDPSNVTLSQAKLDYIRQQLKRVDAYTPIVLFLHHPLGPGVPKYRIRNADQVIQLFADHSLVAAISGHYHGAWETRVDGVWYSTSTCLTDTRKNHDGTSLMGYRIFTLDGYGIESRFVAFQPESVVAG